MKGILSFLYEWTDEDVTAIIVNLSQVTQISISGTDLHIWTPGDDFPFTYKLERIDPDKIIVVAEIAGYNFLPMADPEEGEWAISGLEDVLRQAVKRAREKS